MTFLVMSLTLKGGLGMVQGRFIVPLIVSFIVGSWQLIYFGVFVILLYKRKGKLLEARNISF